MTKANVRKELSRCWRKHWVNAFMELEYNPKLSDKLNISNCFDWLYKDGQNWDNVLRELQTKRARA